MPFEFPFQTSSELSECTQSLFSEYLLEWIALKSFSLLQVKRVIKNLWFNVPQETREFDSLGLKACSPAERMVMEIKLALWFWGFLQIYLREQVRQYREQKQKSYKGSV